MAAEVRLPGGTVRRMITPLRGGWQVDDSYTTTAGVGEFTVHWQFPPETILEPLGKGRFGMQRRGVRVRIEVAGNWEEIEGVTSEAMGQGYAGTVSPAFRGRSWAPYLHLRARGGEKPCVLRTTFLASDAS